MVVWVRVGFWALFKHKGRRSEEDGPSWTGCTLCPPWQKGGGDEEPRYLGGLLGLCPGAIRRGSHLEERLAEFSSWLCKWESSQWLEKLGR